MENSTKASEIGRSKSFKDTFIFGSWKCRNAAQKSKKTGIVEPIAIDHISEEKKYQHNMPTANCSNSIDYISLHDNDYGNCNDSLENSTVSQYEKLEDSFWCPRCNRRMHEPRLLPCLHSVCATCVKEFMNEENDVLSKCEEETFQGQQKIEVCPVCDFPLPTYGSPIPPPHYSLQHKLVLYSLQRRLSHRTVCCDSCPDEVQATLHCSTCLCNFCSDCGVEHEEEKARDLELIAHKIRPIWEAKKVRRMAVCLAHPSHPLRFHCIACQQVTCRECMWRGAHRGHASEDAASAGKRAIVQLMETLENAKILLSSVLTKYNERIFLTNTLNRSYTVHGTKADRYIQSDRGRISHFRSRSATSSHTKEARERIQEFSRLKRARYLIDAISLSEDLLANGSDVEILNLSRTILKRLKTLGVTVEQQENTDGIKDGSTKYFHLKPTHTGIYHCCTFCSSGGKKEVMCACNGTMPGGYKGCGHGHAGHPGIPHWSCCGSTCRDGYCLAARKCTYQMVL